MSVHYHTVHFHVPVVAIICVIVMDAKLVSVEVLNLQSDLSPRFPQCFHLVLFLHAVLLLISYYKLLQDIGQFHSPRMKPYKSAVQ